MWNQRYLWPYGKKIKYHTHCQMQKNCEHINFRTVYCCMSKTAKISLCKLDTKPPSNTWCCCLQFSLPSHSREHNLCNKCGRSLKNKFRTSTGFLRNCINRGYNCKDHSSFDFISAVLMIYFIYICHKMETVTTM